MLLYGNSLFLSLLLFTCLLSISPLGGHRFTIPPFSQLIWCMSASSSTSFFSCPFVSLLGFYGEEPFSRVGQQSAVLPFAAFGREIANVDQLAALVNCACDRHLPCNDDDNGRRQTHLLARERAEPHVGTAIAINIGKPDLPTGRECTAICPLGARLVTRIAGTTSKPCPMPLLPTSVFAFINHTNTAPLH